MKKAYKIATIIGIVCPGFVTSFQGQTVSDFEGNVYHTVTIGDQAWLKENLKTRYYGDGTPITDVMAYNNSSSHAKTYGRLYTWDAAMNGATAEKAQGACPKGWHVPSNREWDKLAVFLGGHAKAGGKLKESGTGHWNPPNTGATNASGFTALPSGEYDTEKEKFQLLHDYAVMWSSTGGGGSTASYYYLSSADAALQPHDYDNTFYYAVRCIKDEPTSFAEPSRYGLLIYPNPFDLLLHIDHSKSNNPSNVSEAVIYNTSGKLIKSFTMSEERHQEDLHCLSPGVYYLKIRTGNNVKYRKIVKK